MKRYWPIALGIVLIVAGMVYELRGAIAVRLMTAAAARAMSADAVAELPDGLTVALCGAGSPLPDPKRSGPCVVVVAGKHVYEVDAGASAGRNMTRLGFAPGRIEALFLTHFHSDHIDGLGEVAELRWAGGAHTEPLPVIGPTGVEQVIDGFNTAYALDAGYRTAHHGPKVTPPQGRGSVAKPFDPPAIGAAPVVWTADGLTVTAFSVHHDPVTPAVGYRFEYGGRTVVISGDTAKSANLELFAHNVDLLVHEALSPELVGILGKAAGEAGRANVAQIMGDILNYHTAPIEVAQIAAAANVRHLLFYHVIPPLLVPGVEAAFLKGVADIYHGPVTLGRDGTQITLPQGSTAILVDQLPF
jgi:ribonuclease Z